VPAGKFSSCLEIITEVTLDEKKEDWSNSYMTYSYYALDIGLVKETQKKPDGETTYTLELTKFQINN